MEPSTYQGVGRSPWELLIRSLGRGQLCREGLPCVPEEAGPGPAARRAEGLAGKPGESLLGMCGADSPFGGKRIEGSFFGETEAGGQGSLGFAGCAEFLVEMRAEPPQSAVLSGCHPVALGAWGAWGAEPALGSPLAHTLGHCITSAPFVFSVGHNYKPINSSSGA